MSGISPEDYTIWHKCMKIGIVDHSQRFMRHERPQGSNSVTSLRTSRTPSEQLISFCGIFYYCILYCIHSVFIWKNIFNYHIKHGSSKNVSIPVYETNTFNLNMQLNVIMKSRNFDVHSPSKVNYIGNPDYNSSLQLVFDFNWLPNVTVFCFSVQNHQEANFSCQELQCLFHSGIRLVNIAAYASKVV
jgi:hypothetical protein